MRCFDLVAAGGAERQHDQRPFHLAQHPIIEPGRGQTAFMSGKLAANVMLNRGGEPLSIR